MNNQDQTDPWPVVLLEWTGRTLVVVFSVAMLSVVGYALIGGLVGTIGMMLHLDWLANSAPPIGWLAGAVAGLVSGIGKFAKPFLHKRAAPAESEPEQGTEQDAAGEPSQVAKRQWVRPSVAELLKTTSVFTLIGGGLGMLLSVYLGIVLISVTTCPFTPPSWRPGTAAYVADEDDPVGSHHRQESPSGVGMGTSFYHPLLGPIIGYTVVPMLALGFVAGIGLSFFPDASESD